MLVDVASKKKLTQNKRENNMEETSSRKSFQP
jgi:hypothetical protein